MRRSRHVSMALLAAVCFTAQLSVATAQSESGEETPNAASTAQTAAGQPVQTPEVSPSVPSKFQVHGFLTQAFATSDGNTLLGIPENGTFDYREAALQLAYEITKKDKVVFQVAHGRLGESPAQEIRGNVELDWLFYAHDFTDATSVKAGRVLLPLGIYNEIRDVGTLLPFYRPPANTYRDAAFTSETVDGAMFSHTFAHGSDWSLDTDTYYGGWTRIERNTTPGTNEAFVTADVDHAIGLQVWLNTPVDGLRFGGHVSRYDVSGGIRTESDSDFTTMFSVDGNFQRLMARAEFFRIEFSSGRYRTYYGQLGYRFTDKLMIVGQADIADFYIENPFLGSASVPFMEDFAVGVNYAFRYNIVAKGEFHWTQGYEIENRTVNIFFEPPAKTNYLILSLSLHF